MWCGACVCGTGCSSCTKKRGREPARPHGERVPRLPLLGCLLLPALGFLGHANPPFHPCGCANGSSAPAPAAAAWHAHRMLPDALASGPGPACVRAAMTQYKKMGVSVEHPRCGVTASSRPSSCRQRPSSHLSSPFLLLERWLLSLAHRSRVVTTGGLSHPPSYKM